jgi:hypothetical protein
LDASQAAISSRTVTTCGFYAYGCDPDRISASEQKLTTDEARRISKLIAPLPELVELEKDRDGARSRRKPQPLRFSRRTARPQSRCQMK